MLVNHMQPLPKIVGIINITPDSMSDGALYLERSAAVKRASELISDGASVIDVGGASTRPGGDYVSPQEEWSRLEPVLKDIVDLSHASDVQVSIDTYQPTVAEKALALGVDYINDVSGMINKDMIAIAQNFSKSGIVFAHSLSVPVVAGCCVSSEQNIVPYLIKWAIQRIELLTDAGIALERLIFDPGLGFGKGETQDWEIVSNIDTIRNALGVKVMVGHSRKRFLDYSLSPMEKGTETVALSIMDAITKVEYIRVHDVKKHVKAFQIVSKYRRYRM